MACTHNRTHNWLGHVFQGRFKAIIVQQREAYLLELARYVVLNPVRAGICDLPETSALPHATPAFVIAVVRWSTTCADWTVRQCV